MSPLIIRGNGKWIGVLLLGIILVAAGLFYIGSGFLIGSDGDELSSGTERKEPNFEKTGSEDTLDSATGDPGIRDDSGDGTGDSMMGEPSESGSSPWNGDSGNIKGKNAFFVEYRLERDRIRSQQIDLLRGIVNNKNSADEISQEAQRRLLGISQAIDTEMKLENLIRAENFKDSVVFVEDKSVTIIIQAPILTEPDREKLTEITEKITGLDAENISVSAKA